MVERALRLLLVAGTTLVMAAALTSCDRSQPTSGALASAPHEHARYQCPMHPQIVADEPGLCPICRMELQRVSDFTDAPRAGDALPVRDGNGTQVAGRVRFALAPERQQLIGVQRGRVERRALEIEVRGFGRVAHDPALYQAIVEYREALRAQAKIAAGTPEAQRGASALARAAALKLRQQGLSEAQLAALVRDGRDPVELLVPGDAAWLYVQVFEDEAALIEPGQTMTVDLPTQPGRPLTAKVLAVDQLVDPATRTVRVRALVHGADPALKPGGLVDATIHVPLGEKVAVPRDAVLETGAHHIVFVVSGEGSFEPRSVTLGRASDAYYEVLGGLAVGDEVVTSANFFIDAESRLRAALASFDGKTATGATKE